MTELWLVDLEAAAPALEEVERVTPRLAGDDRARALRVANLVDRRQRLAAYMALRILLERRVGPRARGQAFTRGPEGKPRLAAASTAFSLAHIDGLALIGVAPEGTIGVDLERARPLAMSARRAHHILAVGSGLAATSRAKRTGDDALLAAWCRLEAFAKAHGQGVARVLEEVGVRGGRVNPAMLDEVEAAARALARMVGVTARDLEMPPGLFAAVAAARHARSLAPRRFPSDARAIEALAVPVRAATR
jgi:4'-phosphopantetheinyl transferase